MTNESWEAYKEKILALPEEERKREIFNLSMLWDDDWKFICLFYENLTDEEYELKRKQYYEGLRNLLQEAFGYTGIL